MTDDSKYGNGFTAEDIERYHSGKMSSLEMHRLEKAAMEDPFLADALEGYAFTTTPAKDRAWLQSQLQSKTEAAKVILLKRFNRNQFLRIAALSILLIGCGWAVYQFGFNSKSDDLALSNTPAYKTSAPLKPDSTPNEATLDQSANSTDTNANSNNTETARSETDDTNLNTQITTRKKTADGTVTLATQNRHTGRIDNGSHAKRKSENDELANIKQGDIAAANEEKASALVSTEGKVMDVTKDSAREKQTYSNDKDFAAIAPQQTVTPGKENVIVLQRNKNAEPIPEVVLGKSMKDSTYRKPLITFEEAVPEKGSKYFDDYVAQNLQLPEEELRKNISGEVKLSFDVNDSGEAVNISVVKSLCTECDKEAIRLLQQGPKWVKKKNARKGTVSIKF